MTYEDIADWAENNYPMSNYDDFNEWLADVTADFVNSGHLNGRDLPTEAIDVMAGRWHRFREPELQYEEGDTDEIDYPTDTELVDVPKPREPQPESIPSFGIVPSEENIPQSYEVVIEPEPQPQEPVKPQPKPLVNRERILQTQSPKGLEKAERFASVKRFIRSFRRRR